MSGYNYPMYSSSWLYSGMTVPPPPPPSTTTDQEIEPDRQGTSTTSTMAASSLWQPYAGPTHWERRVGDRSPRHHDVSPMDDVQWREQASDRSWLDAFQNYPRPDFDNVTWLETTFLSSACRVCEPSDDHVINLKSAQRVQIGAWRSRAVKTDIHFYLPGLVYGEVQPCPKAMQENTSLVVPQQKILFVPNDGVTVTVQNASRNTLTLRPGVEIADLIIVQLLVPKFVLQNTNKRDRDSWTPLRQRRPCDGDNSMEV